MQVFSGSPILWRFARYTKTRRVAESLTRLKRCASSCGTKVTALLCHSFSHFTFHFEAASFAELEAHRFTLRVSVTRRDTKVSRKDTKTQQGSKPRQSAKREVDIICGTEDNLLYRDEVYAIQGAVFDVYKTMGNMWGEEVYQRMTKCKLGLLINFGSYPRVTIERFAL